MALVAVRDIAQEAVRALSQVTGTSVQVYAEDRIYQQINHTFNLLFKEKDVWWDTLMQWFDATIDGSTGVATQDLSAIDQVDDIRAIFRDNSDRPMPILPASINPYRLSGNVPRFIEFINDPDRHFRTWPRTVTETLRVHARVHPGVLTVDSNVNFDKDVLVHGASYFYAEDDGTNPGAIQKFQGLFELRRGQLLHARSNLPSVQSNSGGSFPDTWQESP
jgi:hypothetical protein